MHYERQITDNALIAFEVVIANKRKRKRETRWALLLNMSKAYDRVE